MLNKNKEFLSSHFIIKLKIKYKKFFFFSVKRKHLNIIKNRNFIKKIFIFFIKKNKNLKFFELKVYQFKIFKNNYIKFIKNIFLEIFFLFKKISYFTSY